MKKRKEYLYRPSKKPKHEKLSWPGLRAKDRLSRVATRAVKEAKETRENEEWAESLIARMLDYVPPETAMRLLFQETFRGRKPYARRQTLAKRTIGIHVGQPAPTGRRTGRHPKASKRK